MSSIYDAIFELTNDKKKVIEIVHKWPMRETNGTTTIKPFSPKQVGVG
jgi:hypothetical protein